MTEYYKEFLITAEPFITEVITSVLWNLNIDGITEEVNCIKVFSHDLNLSQNEIEVKLNKLVENKLLRNFEVQENILTEKNWNEEWENSREVIEISERIIIKPSFKEYKNDENKIVITLDPKMSFGTGEHPTTKICIQLLEQYLKSGDKVLDVGCGTAILSIVAAKLGATKTIGFDIDDWSFENSKENIVINQVEDLVEIRKCTIEEITENNFDIIIANIQRNVLVEIANEIKNRIKPGGILILSGLLENDLSEIREIYTTLNFSKLNSVQKHEWFVQIFKSNL